MQITEIAPVRSCRFTGGTAAIPGLVEEVLGEAGGLDLTSGVHVLLAPALGEVLLSIQHFCGPQTASDASAVDLWIDRAMVIICVRFRGAPLPGWLLANWDRGETPERLAPGTRAGWRWLIVRDAFHAVSHSWRGSEQVLFLERRS